MAKVTEPATVPCGGGAVPIAELRQPHGPFSLIVAITPEGLQNATQSSGMSLPEGVGKGTLSGGSRSSWKVPLGLIPVPNTHTQIHTHEKGTSCSCAEHF